MIKFIDNQTIAFKSENDEDCGCGGQKFCQLVTPTDTTNFQLLGDIVNVDPNFTQGLDAYQTYVAIELNADFEGISADGECDGTITAVASGGSGDFEYSIDGGVFGVSGEFDNLCAGVYLITVKDSDGHYATRYITIAVRYDCSAVADSYANEVEDDQTYDLLNCYANDFI